MKLKLLDINEYIEKNNLKEVTSTNIYASGGKLDPKGLFSEEIFGRLGSKERRDTFGYIQLKHKFIHPECYTIITSLDTNLSALINDKRKYKINNGEIIEDEKGESGVAFFVSIFDKINWEKLDKKHPDHLKFVIDNKDKILIDKFLVLPAGIRDIQTSTKTGKTMIQYSEITDLYKTLIQQNNTLLIQPGSEIGTEIIGPMVQRIQRTLIEIDTWFKDRMKGKQGFIRKNLSKKVIDYSGRFVITTDNTLELGYVGLPFNYILKLYEPFALHYIFEKDKTCLGLIQNFLKSDLPPEISDLKRFFTKLTEDSTIIDEQLKQTLIEVAKEITKDKVVLYKRDPVENRDSYLAASVRVDSEGYTLAINPLDLPRVGGDHDGDAMAVIALFTDEAIKEAKEKMHPKYAKSMWVSVANITDCPYKIDLDAAAAIYSATRR